jgi:hypothetical protein
MLSTKEIMKIMDLWETRAYIQDSIRAGFFFKEFNANLGSSVEEG